MNIIGNRIKSLRESVGLSQSRIAGIIGTTQASINRYEQSQSNVPPEKLLWYADYFDVSLDYIFGRTDDPQGKLYDHHPKIEQDIPELERFVEMCFDPASPMNERLKETLLRMLKEMQE